MTKIRQGVLILVFFSLINWSWAKEQKDQFHLAIELSDGSYIKGVTKISTIPLQTSYAKMAISLDRIRQITFKNEEIAVLQLNNRDRLTGVIKLSTLDLTTIFGEVSVYLKHISKIDVYSGALLEKGLIAFYPFNGNARDESGNGNHGIEYGGLTYTKGKIGQAAHFDGVDDYITVTPQSNVSAIGDFTISVWTYVENWKTQVNSKRDRQYIFDGHTYSNTTTSNFYRQGFCLIYDYEEIHNAIYYGHSVSFLEQDIKIQVKQKWCFIVFMRRGKDDYTYVNGKLIPATYMRRRNNKKSDLLDMNHNWYIGTFSGNNPNYKRGVFNYSFYGLLDNMRIYDRALSPSEIRILYREGNP